GLAAKNAQMVPGGPSRHTQVSWQRAAAGAGVRFVNVSPVRADTEPDLRARWVPIRPATDTALMLALCHVLLTEDLADTDFARRCCVGFDRFRDYVLGTADGCAKDAEWAAAITDIPAGDISDLARQIAAHRTVINLAWSIQRQDHGEQPYWAGIALAALSGSFGRPGGGPAAGLGIAETGVRGHWSIAALPQPPNPVSPAMPVARIADVLLHPGATIDYNGARLTCPDIRLVYWAGGNPFHHHQDLGRLARAWQRPDTVIVHEAWWNANARHADIVLPVATPLEREDLALGSSDTTITAMHRAAAPPADVPTDHRAFAALRADPDAHPIATPSGRVELVSDTVAGFGYPDCPGMPVWLEPAEWLGAAGAARHPLHLVSNQPRTRLHSQYDGARASREAKVAGREPVDLHPDDARARGIADGDVVRIHNDRGACLAGARLTDAVRPGVVVLATGAWYDPDADGLDRHGNPNVLTR